MQKNLFDRLAKLNKCKAGIRSVAISSIFQVSKTFNSTVNGDGILRYFICNLVGPFNFKVYRSYPKMDGSLYTYNPSGRLTTESLEDVAKELESQVIPDTRIYGLYTLFNGCLI